MQYYTEHVQDRYIEYLSCIDMVSVKMETAIEDIYDKIKERIAAGTLKPGDDLLAEYENAIREAAFYAGFKAGMMSDD